MAVEPLGSVKRRFVTTIDVNLCKLWKSCSIVACTESVNVTERARSLCAKLITREVKDDKSLVLIGFIEFL